MDKQKDNTLILPPRLNFGSDPELVKRMKSRRAELEATGWKPIDKRIKEEGHADTHQKAR